MNVRFVGFSPLEEIRSILKDIKTKPREEIQARIKNVSDSIRTRHEQGLSSRGEIDACTRISGVDIDPIVKTNQTTINKYMGSHLFLEPRFIPDTLDTIRAMSADHFDTDRLEEYLRTNPVYLVSQLELRHTLPMKGTLLGAHELYIIMFKRFIENIYIKRLTLTGDNSPVTTHMVHELEKFINTVHKPATTFATWEEANAHFDALLLTIATLRTVDRITYGLRGESRTLTPATIN